MSDAAKTECSSCGTPVPEAARFCGACGVAVVSEDLPTLSSPAPRASSTRSPSSHSSSSPARPASEPRFVPGTVLAARYRIVAPVGKGGMGEVYRADDLTLNQPVALKFLPSEAENEDRLERFRGEVRIARRVSHPNVCRVYDIGEAEGRHFLSMEFVDGEDLASLLKRIGHLPEDKAVEVARAVCAGLAAAHEKGVLHRDLKPANVMLDRQGLVVITDFGLAALADQVPERDIKSGTPTYMAPEQLSGGEVTVKSDIYALGLVLYEIFTGRRAGSAKTLADQSRTRTETRSSSPSSSVHELDPAIERVILWCLEKDPERRPRSALAVAAALPGGDRLAAALEAGETPSPEIVAEAGGSAVLQPKAALLRLGAVVLGLAAILVLALRSSGLDRVALEPPEIMAQRAREILADLGQTQTPVDVASGYGREFAQVRYLEGKRLSRQDWDRVLGGRPPVLFYWYRTSPRRMLVLSFASDLLLPGIVDIWSPPANLAGMANLGLDAKGRLNFLQVLPPEIEASPKEAKPPDWDALFRAAGLDRALFQPADPTWTSLAASDARAAWTGVWPGSEIPLRVEAAAFHGKPVFFNLVGPWTPPYRTNPDPRTPGEQAALVAMVQFGLAVMIGAAILARRSWVSGRGDRRGALRLALFVFCVHQALFWTTAHHVASTGEFPLVIAAISYSLFMAGFTWLLYLSLEPYVRKHWPQTVISWSRLLAGRVRDPLVGRDLLAGVMLGLLWSVIIQLSQLAIRKLGAAPLLGGAEYLAGARGIAAAWLGLLLGSIQSALVFFLVLFVLRVILRRPWLAATVFAVLLSVPTLLATRYLPVEGPAQLAVFAIAAVAVVRFGLVALVAGMLTTNLVSSVPVSASLSSWYSGSMVIVFLSVLALAVFGFITSLGAQRLLSTDAFE